MKRVKAEDTTISMDGPEVCRIYFETDKILFGSSTLLPGQTGGIDSGHPHSHEVFFVSKGEVLMHNTKMDEFYELHAGDALLVEEGEPHELTNIGMNKAVITWSCAPNPAAKA